MSHPPVSVPHDHGACVHEALARAQTICDARGVKLTPLRGQVLEIVWRSHKPAGAYEVLDELHKVHKAARPPTVYRALEFLEAEGLIHRIESQNAYLGCIEAGAPHSSQFLICRGCGAAEEIADRELDAAIAVAAERVRFKAERKTVEISGLCARCA